MKIPSRSGSSRRGGILLISSYRIIGVDNSWRDGEEIITPNGFHTGKYQSGYGVVITSSFGDKDTLKNKVNHILGKILPTKELLLGYMNGGVIHGIININLSSDKLSGYAGIYLNEETVQQFAKWNLSIDIDVY